MDEEKEKREVLYIWPYLEWGGVQVYLIGIMKLARERYNVRALMPRGSAERLVGYLTQLNVPCEFFNAHVDMSPARTLTGKLRRRWRKAYSELAIVQYVGWRRARRSLLHVDFGPWSSFWSLLYMALNSDVFVTLHTALPHTHWLRRQEWRLKFRILCSLPGFHLLASNQNMIESLKPILPTRLIAEIPLAYSGVDRNEIEKTLQSGFDRSAVCGNYGLLPESFFVFGMGQFIERKGCWVLLESARELLKDHPDLCFIWIGTTALDQETKLRIDGYELGDRFRVMTSDEIGQGRSGLMSLLRLADLFVLPSFTEGLPVALIEAMALGKPCVASNINAIPEAIQDGKTGFLVARGDSNALADAIAELKAQGHIRERIATSGQDYVLKNFDERLTAQITVDQYDACKRSN